jgi:transposase-like protein
MPGKRQKAFEMHLQRKPTDEIAKALHVSEYTVVTWIREEVKGALSSGEHPSGVLQLRKRGRSSPAKNAIGRDQKARPSRRLMMKKTKPSPIIMNDPRKQEARRMAQAGVPQKEIVKQLGVARSTASRWTSGIYKQRREKLRKQAICMAKDGATTNQIASELGIEQSTARGWVGSVLRERQSRQAERVRRLARSGLVPKQIARQENISISTVRWWTQGIRAAERPILNPRQRAELQKRAKQMALEGKSAIQIAQTLGIERTTAWKWTQKELRAYKQNRKHS